MININLFKLLKEYISKKIEVLDKQLDYYNRLSAEEKYHIETGEKFNILIEKYPISKDELLDIDKIICEYVLRTRNTDIKKYFFIDDDMVRLPFMLYNYTVTDNAKNQLNSRTVDTYSVDFCYMNNICSNK